MRRLALLGALVLVLTGCGASAGTDGEPARARPQALVEDLQAGGFVLYLRHTLTDRSEKDHLGAPLDDCSRQRNLTDEGREHARQLGEAIRALGIPTGDVLSSEYCRCLETARLAFRRVAAEPLLTGLPDEEGEEWHRRVTALQELLGEPPPGGANRVIVGHVKNLEAATGVGVQEGETAVFEPLGEREFRLAGRIPAAAWPQLAGALAGG